MNKYTVDIKAGEISPAYLHLDNAHDLNVKMCKKYGIFRQVLKASEELSECAASINRDINGHIDSDYFVTPDDLFSNGIVFSDRLLDDIASAFIMLSQLMLYDPKEISDRIAKQLLEIEKKHIDSNAPEVK